ncbi:DNA-formamidopyrimidine glycosylase [Anopheles sinensis]|uniref:DNA-formamidopyrimidine glycosylase n=1 Tax=Anopheles sinensis TaxID=74873 RepID=A0A084VE93_ANOSI|nr:DNA-formamidopyrimidine glycosylase [Anopheles sinensis]
MEPEVLGSASECLVDPITRRATPTCFEYQLSSSPATEDRVSRFRIHPGCGEFDCAPKSFARPSPIEVFVMKWRFWAILRKASHFRPGRQHDDDDDHLLYGAMASGAEREMDGTRLLRAWGMTSSHRTHLDVVGRKWENERN